jgi:PIN domain nuclease of toxin-antitoxin system
VRFLLDTDIALWWLTDDVRLPRLAREIVEDENNEILVSVVTLWEIANRVVESKLKASATEMENALQSDGISILTLTAQHCEHMPNIAAEITDLFDRMLIAQSQSEQVLFLTNQPELAQAGRSVVTV